MQKAMYAPYVNSPQTSLVTSISNTQTSITVVDGSNVPEAPNLLVIGDGDNAETILYTSKVGNVISGITRGFQGLASAWNTGTNIARYFTAYDQQAIQDNLADHFGDNTNPHNVTVSQIGAETPVGAQTKADTAQTNSKAYTDLHSGLTNNPHSITLDQIGAASKSEIITLKLMDGFVGVRIEYNWIDETIAQQLYYDENDNIVKQIDYEWLDNELQKEIYVQNEYDASNQLKNTYTVTVTYMWLNGVVVEMGVVLS